MGKSRFKPGDRVHVEFDAVVRGPASGDPTNGEYQIDADVIVPATVIYETALTSLEQPLSVKALPPFTVFRADVPSWPGVPFVKLRGGAVHLFRSPAFFDPEEPSTPVIWKNKDYSNIEILFQLPEDEDA